jgi:hypothetical protein
MPIRVARGGGGSRFGGFACFGGFAGCGGWAAWGGCAGCATGSAAAGNARTLMTRAASRIISRAYDSGPVMINDTTRAALLTRTSRL